MQTLWLGPTAYVTGDPSLRISYPFVSHPGAVVTCTAPGDLKWISIGVALPQKAKIEQVIVCYEVSNSQSFISQVRLAEMETPDHATVLHDDPTPLQSTSPATYASSVGGLAAEGAVSVELRLNFQNTSDEIRLGALGVTFQSPAQHCVTSIAALKALGPGVVPCLEVLGYYAPGDGGGGSFYWDALAAEPDDTGTIIAPASNPSTGRWIRIYSGPLNVRWFGAKPDPSTQNDTAFNNAINALPGPGGTIFFPNSGAISPYYFASTIDISGKNGITFQGEGAGEEGGGVTFLNYTGSACAIRANNTVGFRMYGMSILCTNMAAGGILMDLTSPTATRGSKQNTALVVLRDCRLWIRSVANPQIGSVIDLDGAQQTEIEATYILGGNIGVQGVATSGSFSNANAIRDCFFQQQGTMPIQNPGQGWVIEGCTFEPLAVPNVPNGVGKAGAVFVDNNGYSTCHGLTYIGNWHGDSVGGGDWVTIQGEGIIISGNQFLGGSRAIRFNGVSCGVTITSNDIGGMQVAGVDFGSYAHTNICVLSNNWGVNDAPNFGTWYNGKNAVYAAPLPGCIIQANGTIDVFEQLQAVDGLATKVKAGTISDADFAVTPVDGTLAVDTIDNRLYVRIGGAWKSVTLS